MIYQTEPDNEGKTSFRIKAKVKAAARYGTVGPGFVLASMFSPANNDLATKAIDGSLNFTIDWNHLVFQPEAHVMLQSENANNVCLDAWGAGGWKDGSKVGGYQCNDGAINHKWGLDDLGRYKSRTNSNLCLNVEQDHSLVLRQCNHSQSQKWVWKGNKLHSKFVDDTDSQYVLSLKSNVTSGDRNRVNVVVEPLDMAKKSDWNPVLSNPKF